MGCCGAAGAACGGGATGCCDCGVEGGVSGGREWRQGGVLGLCEGEAGFHAGERGTATYADDGGVDKRLGLVGHLVKDLAEGG